MTINPFYARVIELNSVGLTPAAIRRETGLDIADINEMLRARPLSPNLTRTPRVYREAPRAAYPVLRSGAFSMLGGRL